MLATVPRWRHLVVGLAIGGFAGLAGCGVIGSGDQGLLRPEHFDAKQVTAVPDGADGVRIREVVDIDFGLTERRGYQRIVPNDFGEPVDIAASSPNANDEVNTLRIGSNTRIRIGNPSITFTGQRRYVLEYTLPDAQLATGVLALDIIGTDETMATDRFEVVLSGFELEDVTCDTGAFGTFGGCDLVARNGDLVTVVEPLDPGEGITVGGTIVGRTDAVFGELPPPPGRNPGGIRPLGLALVPLGMLTAVAIFAASRWYGSNEVRGGGGAADAAFGDLPLPRAGDPIADVPTYRVPDARLADLATIEFVPPRGVEPWQAAALLSEDIGDDTVAAWFSEMIAREAIVVDDDEGDVVLRRGQGIARLSAVDQGHLAELFGSKGSVRLGTYSAGFQKTWRAIRTEQERFIEHSGWWTRGAPDGSFDTRALRPFLLTALIMVVVVGRTAIDGGLNVLAAIADPIAAAVLALALVALVAYLAYRAMLPSRSATGSALTLRAESFRRFLAASEGRHVDWAWENGLLREYSAWAVALGAADAWSDAVRSSNVPHPDDALRGPLVIHSSAGSFRSARTPPSSSGSGGSGFSGGGGVGGGGGGGSSGSW